MSKYSHYRNTSNNHITPKEGNDGSPTDRFMVVVIEDGLFTLQGELTRLQLEDLSDDISRTLGESHE